MTWQSSGVTPASLNWANISGMTRANVSAASIASLWYNSTPKTFSNNKNYLFITNVENFRRLNLFTHSKFLNIISPWGTSFSYATASTSLLDTRPNSNATELYWFSKPNSQITGSDYVEFRSTYNGFGNPSSDADGRPVIKNFKLVELDWFIQGWSLTSESTSRGWSYNEVNNSIIWKNSTTSSSTRRSVGGHTSSNYITRYISYPKFNMKFNANIPIGYWIDIYLVNNINGVPISITNFSSYLNNSNNAQFLGRVNGAIINEEINFYDLTGEKSLLINASYLETNTNNIELSNFVFDGSYQENDNNSQFLFTNTNQFSEPTPLSIIGGSTDATYSTIIANENTLHNPATNSFFGPTGFPGFFSTLYGNVINLNQLNSKVGNGTFKSGIWENGVWNNGWRVDTEVYEFNDILFSIQTNTMNNKWRIQINGTTQSVSNFEIGDKISIGNIVAIDINDNRRLIKGLFTIISKDDNNIGVEFSNTFPFRRIEKDSENHKIKVTKNVWLNGAFFNGYFEGVWNNGLFKGFPYITEMYNSHWVDGYFDGGHFYGEYPEWSFVDTFYNFDTAPNTLGLTFSTSHGLVVGDKVIIDKDDKNINPQYDGESEVIAVLNENSLIINKAFGQSSTSESGLIKRKWGTGIIQYFNFNDNNVSKRTNLQTSNLQEVYKYNSWIDVKYLTQSASNLGRDQITYVDSTPTIIYNELNLYGFITNDVLSSDSSFRNSWSLAKSKYTLGTKWRIFNDFLGEISEFNEPFSTLGTIGMDNFYNNGWTLSTTTGYNIERLSDESIRIIKTASTLPSNSTTKLDNTNISIEKKRYSLIEFDLNNFQSLNDTFGSTPFIHFYNKTNLSWTASSAFTISDYVYHTRTEDIKKREYFYNRRTLDIFLQNQSSFTASFDNIKFYEVDMIPFFQYTTEEYINKGVQVPFQGIAPFIDYDNLNFSFIDNINIQLDSLSTQQTFTQPVISSGGVNSNNIIVVRR